MMTLSGSSWEAGDETENAGAAQGGGAEFWVQLRNFRRHSTDQVVRGYVI